MNQTAVLDADLMTITFTDIGTMTRAEAMEVLAEVRAAIASLPPVKRRPHIKDQSRDPDVRTAFEDHWVIERIKLQMALTDLTARMEISGPPAEPCQATVVLQGV